jgi:hypothetical protein
MLKKMIGITAALLLTATFAIAQNDNNARQQRLPSHDRQQRGSIGQAIEEQQSSALTGCLNLAGGTYWLSNRKGKSYRLTGNTGNLDRLVGHQVRVAGDRPGSNNKIFRVNRASDVSSTCSVASEPLGTRVRNAPFEGSQGGTVGPPQNWGKKSADKSRAETNSVNSGIAEPADRADDAYQRHPQQPAADKTMPNPPLNHARPEDQTPSAGPARDTTSAKSRHHRSEKKQDQRSNSSHQNSTPPPQL